MRTTLKDIAEKVGIDVSVVSVVLNNRPSRIGVSEKRRKQILSAARELDYRPNSVARQLKGQPSRIIGLIMPNWTHEAPGDLRRYISETLYENGYQTILSTLLDDHSNFNRILDDLISCNVDGIICAKIPLLPPPRKDNIPMVIGFDNQPFGDVGVNLAFGAELAVKHLQSHGHTRIGFLTGDLEQMKCDGWRSALSDYGIKPKKSWHLCLHENIDFRRELDALLKKEKLTAFLCQNDYFAARFLTYLLRHGYKVPDDVALIGFDGTGFSQCLNPPLTTVVQPIRALADKLVELMLAKLRGDYQSLAKPFMVNPYLHLSASCGCVENIPDMIYWRGQSVTLESQQPLEEGIPEALYHFDNRADKESNAWN